MSDRPPTPLASVPSRNSVASPPASRGDLKRLSLSLSVLTADEGPIVMLVKEVRASNVLAKSNQTSLRYTLLVLLFQLCGVFYSLYLVHLTTNEMGALSRTQQTSFAQQSSFAQEALQQLRTTQAAVEEAPKIVANDKGELVIMATVQLDPKAAKAARKKSPPRKRRRRTKKKKSAMLVDDILASDNHGHTVDSGAPVPKQMVAIPLNTEAAYGPSAD